MIVYVDVDDTLVRSFGSKQIAMSHTQEYVRKLKEAGASLYCWSSGGAEYARRVATEAGLADCFIAYLPKPQVLVDDVLVENWELQQLHPNECRSQAGDELLAAISGTCR
ncbi:hypothetical protein ABS71_09295 [bacterium SCN 62-11]|nr:hypothetical protein [Candidatus Eremiobacteraeota bacterium]ODT68978.1 MAG: hypothetical protein ABS71_09295 [bacterium SCN 62-11]